MLASTGRAKARIRSPAAKAAAAVLNSNNPKIAAMSAVANAAMRGRQRCKAAAIKAMPPKICVCCNSSAMRRNVQPARTAPASQIDVCAADSIRPYRT
jgi:hypothetical protein